MALKDADLAKILEPLRLEVKSQGEYIRQLKETNAPAVELQKAIAAFKEKKRVLEQKELELAPPDTKFQRAKLEDLLKQKFYYDQSFSIYGGVTGLYDFGPLGSAVKANFLQQWRAHFVLEEQMLEVDTAMLTPEVVLKASGHVDRFADFMVKDMLTGECFRADHLIEGFLEKLLVDDKVSEEKKEKARKLLQIIDNLGKTELDECIKEFDMKSPVTGNNLSEPMDFNLMFATSIGPTGTLKGFLRPETAQGIFVNFKRLLEFNQGRLPFAAAQIGSAFRNEISPRSGLIRVREFTMAEIEHFCDPTDKGHAKFAGIADTELVLLSSANQLAGQGAQVMTIGHAVAAGIVANETLGYFMARIYLFMLKVGVDKEKLRFRQHLTNEMAHYACDCWDAETRTSYGWIECVGCADRSCFDLTQHTRSTGVKLVAERRLSQPKTVAVVECQPNKAAIGKQFKQKAKKVMEFFQQLSADEAAQLEHKLNSSENAIEIEVDLDGVKEKLLIDKSMVQVKRTEKTIHVEEFVPGVIEPSFGVGRIMYSVFEHNFVVRADDEQRTLIALPPIIAPYKCSILPLSAKPEFQPFVRQLSDQLTGHDMAHRIDNSAGSIGRRYARTDALAIPFGVTIDFDTLNVSDGQQRTATLRERDSMSQIRVPLVDIAPLVRDLVLAKITWSDAMDKYPKFEQQETISAQTTATTHS